MKQKIVLVVSIAVGLLAAVLTRTYLASKDAEIQQLKSAFLKKHQTIEVLCFAREVPSGTILAKSDLGLKTVPASGLRGQALTEEHVIEVIGRKVLNPVPALECVQRMPDKWQQLMLLGQRQIVKLQSEVSA